MKKREIWTIVFVACMVLMYLIKSNAAFMNIIVRPALIILWAISIIMFFKHKNQ